MRTLFIALTFLLSLSAFSSEVSNQTHLMSLPEGTKVIFSKPILFPAGVSGGKFTDNAYIGLELQQQRERILDPRVCVVKGVKVSRFTGNFFNYEFELADENQEEGICSKIELLAIGFHNSVARVGNVNEEFQESGISIVLPDPIHL